jgi:uncharacterized membrane protein YeaQ/YmgE (transglycosylase-associated protein family)
MMLLLVIAIGAFLGWLVGRIVEGYGFGLIANMVVGAIGSFLGAFMGFGLGFSNSSELILFGGIVGAVILLLIIGLFKRRE